VVANGYTNGVCGGMTGNQRVGREEAEQRVANKSAFGIAIL